MSKKCVIIGAGFSGLSVASYLAQAGHEVHVYEKHDMPGGRARYFEAEGFTFDMGPSWYWMPDVFDNYFSHFNKKVSDYYDLVRLDPSYTVVWPERADDIPAQLDKIKELFDSLEDGAGDKLQKFLDDSAIKYKVGTEMLNDMPGFSILEFVKMDFIKNLFKLDVFQSMEKSLNKLFKHPELKMLLEFPILFLGGTAQNTPALYSMMNYADMVMGTWFPKGGMHEIVKGMHALAEELGVQFHFNANVEKIIYKDNKAVGLSVNEQSVKADYVVASCDYHFTEMKLLDDTTRNYKKDYWTNKTFAPSALLYYVGINKTLPDLKHHTLFFDTDFAAHSAAIYDSKTWPEEPLFYVSNTNKTDARLAPEGSENLFFLIPVSPGLEDTQDIRKKFFDKIVTRFEEHVGQPIKDNIVYYREYAASHLIEDYNACQGNAYGLANTLMQTAVMKPKIKNKKLNNLYYTGQLTVPGPGVPPSLISGQLVAQEIIKENKL